jgi:hypothetical protein
MNRPHEKLRIVLTLIITLFICGCSVEPEIVESRTMTCEKYQTKLQWNEWSDGSISVNWQHPETPDKWEPFNGLPYRSAENLHQQIVECVADGTFQYYCYYLWLNDDESLEHRIDWMTQQMILDWGRWSTEIVQCY